MHLHSEDQKAPRQFVTDSMSKQLDGDKRLLTHLVPQYALGCHRMTPGSDYLPSLRRSNVNVVMDSVVGVTKDGVLDSSGRETRVDVTIFATGFDVTKPSYQIIGRNGRNLGEEWAEFPKGYFSIMAEGFPNIFCKFHANLSNIRAILTDHFRLDRTKRSSISWLDPSNYRVAYTLDVQGDLVR